MTTHDGVRVRVSPGPRVITSGASELFAIPRPPAWTESANCLSTDPDLFQSAEDSKGSHFTDAKKICANCSVLEDCRTWAMTIDYRHSVLGGLSPRQRQKLATEKRRADGTLGMKPCGVCGREFEGSPNTRRCSAECEREARRDRNRRAG